MRSGHNDFSKVISSSKKVTKMRFVILSPTLAFSLENSCAGNPEFKKCEEFYTELYYKCLSKCEEPLCSTDCNRELGNNLENCPCKVRLEDCLTQNFEFSMV